MLFSLWLIAVVVSATEAKALVENEDSTELPAPAIKDLVDMKTIVMDLDIWQNLTESDFHREGTEMPAIILEGEMLAFINDEEKEKELTTIPATQTEPAPSPESLEVIQVVNKLDDLPTDNIPLITTPSPEELLKQQQMELNEVANNLGAEDILDVISNFIADVDPTLQLFLSICFVHPSCYQDSPPSASSRASEARALDLGLMTPLARDIADNLIQRRTERARNTLVTAIMRVQAEVKMLMFKYIQIGVQARGVSVPATKNIIDAVKNIWISVNSDLEYAKSSLQELFHVLDLDMEKDKVRALAEVADIITTIPAKVETLYERATQEGYQDYVRHSSWDSWKRNPNEIRS